MLNFMLTAIMFLTLVGPTTTLSQCYNPASGPHIVDLLETTTLITFSIVDGLVYGLERERFFIAEVDASGQLQVRSSIPLSGSGFIIREGYAYFTGGQTGIVDVSDPDAMHHAGTIDSRANGIDVRGGLAYIARGAGFAIYDVDDPAHPVLISELPLFSYTTDVHVAGNIAFITKKNVGIAMVDISNPWQPLELGYIPTPGSNISLDGDLDRLFPIGNELTRLGYLDISNPYDTTWYEGPELPGFILGVTTAGHEIFVACRDAGLIRLEEAEETISGYEVSGQIMEHDRIDRAVLDDTLVAKASSGLATIDPRGWWDEPRDEFIQHIYIRSSIRLGELIVASDYDGIQVYDLSDPSEPQSLSRLEGLSGDLAGNGRDIVLIEGPYSRSMSIVSIADPSLPSLLAEVTFDSRITTIAMADDHAYVLLGSVLEFFDLSTPANPILVSNVELTETFSRITLCGDVWLLSSSQRLAIYENQHPGLGDLLGVMDFSNYSLRDLTCLPTVVYAVVNDAEPLWTIDISDPRTPIVIDTRPTVGNRIEGPIHATEHSIIHGLRYGGATVSPIADNMIPGDPVILNLGYFHAQNIMMSDNAMVFVSVSGLHVLPRLCGDTPPACDWTPGYLDHETYTSFTWGPRQYDSDHTLVTIRADLAEVNTLNANGDLDFRNDLAWSDISNASWCDADNNGTPILYLARNGQPNVLIDNFEHDITPALLADPGNASTAAWFDADNDGLCDLYLVNQDTPNRLFHNQGGLQFSELDDDRISDNGEGRSVAIGDYDNDGDADLYLSNRGTNRLLRNDGNLMFTDVTNDDLADSGDGKAVCWGDADGDGDLDLYLVNQQGSNRFFRNDNNTLVDATTGPLGDSGNGRDAAWIDADNDGDLDLLLANSSSEPIVMINDGTGSFTVDECGLFSVPPRVSSLAPADFDDDGDLDYVLATVYGESSLVRNDSWQEFHWVQLRLVGDESNRNGLGARVRLFCGGQWRMRELTDGAGYQSRAPHLLHFGLGAAAWIDSLEVRWPSGITDMHVDLPVDLVLTLHEGGAVPNFLVEQTAMVRDGRVTLEWRLESSPGDLRFLIARRDVDQGWYVPLNAEPTQNAGSWNWTDQQAQPGMTYTYRVSMIGDGAETVLFESEPLTIPVLHTMLLPNIPNPFNPSTKIMFSLSSPGQVRLDIHDLAGRRVRSLVNGHLSSGPHDIIWNGRHEDGSRLGSGSYLLRLTTQQGEWVRRVSLIK